MMLESERAALMELGRRVVREAANSGDRHAIPDSDLYDEQPCVVTLTASLGELRKAGIGKQPGYTSLPPDPAHVLTLRSIAHNIQRTAPAGGLPDEDAEDLARRYVTTLHLAAEGAADKMAADAVRTWKELYSR